MEQQVEVAGEKLILLPEFAVLWPARRTLFVADVHLGKDASFRSLGVPVHVPATEETLARLSHILEITGPHELVVLGDLWHSKRGRTAEAVQAFLTWRRAWASIGMTLVEGNHDLRSGALPPEADMCEVAEPFAMGPFSLCHYPDGCEAPGYRLAGHVHPAVVLTGKARQSLRLPAFIFGPKMGLLPAFGGFTGMGGVSPTVDDRTFVIAERRVVAVR